MITEGSSSWLFFHRKPVKKIEAGKIRQGELELEKPGKKNKVPDDSNPGIPKGEKSPKIN